MPGPAKDNFSGRYDKFELSLLDTNVRIPACRIAYPTTGYASAISPSASSVIVGHEENLFGQALMIIESVQEDPVVAFGSISRNWLIKGHDSSGRICPAGPKKAWVLEVRPGKACV